MKDPNEEYVRVPEGLYRLLERRAGRATELEQEMIKASVVLTHFQITGVITSPPTGEDARAVLSAVNSLVLLAKETK